MTDALDLSTHHARAGDVRVRLASPVGPSAAVRVTLGNLRVQVSPLPKWAWTVLWAGAASLAAWVQLKESR